jgi:hypothetical protein
MPAKRAEVRDGVSVVALISLFTCRLPLQSDARDTALDFRLTRHMSQDLLDRRAPADIQSARLPLAAIVGDVMTTLVKNGHWPALRVVGPNRQPIAQLDRGLIGMESTVPPVRSAVI